MAEVWNWSVNRYRFVVFHLDPDPAESGSGYNDSYIDILFQETIKVSFFSLVGSGLGSTPYGSGKLVPPFYRFIQFQI